MIQRVQTIFMLIVVVITAAIFFLPIAVFTNEAESFKLTLTGIDGSDAIKQTVNVNTIPLIISVVVGAIFSFINIFLYRKRLLQIKINRFAILLFSLYLALMYFLYIDKIKTLFTVDNTSLMLSAALPIVNIILLFLANVRIRRDDKLVKSADRLR